MRYFKGKQVKIISGASDFDFESKLNSYLSELNRRGVQYDLKLDPSTGFLAYIVYEEQHSLPETVAEEYEVAGEHHVCAECPYYVMPTDGRVKYTRCKVINGITDKKSACCDFFFEELRKGRIKLKEIWNGESEV